MNKKFITALGASLSLFLLVGCGGGAANTTDTTNTTATAASVTNTASTTTAAGNISIAFGSMFGKQFGEQMGFTAEYLKGEDFVNALLAALNGQSKMEQQQIEATLKDFMTAVQASKNPQNPAPMPKPLAGTLLADALGSAVGLQIATGKVFKSADFNAAEMAAAFEDARAGKPQMDEATFIKVIESRMPAPPPPPPPPPADPQAEKAGKEFLAANAKKANIKTTPSGLQYEVLKEGKGTRPTLQNTVKVHYHGTLINGKVFDSSVERGQPIEFGLGQVIKGWQEGVALMTPGSKYKLYIPHELGYGGQNAGQIPPYSTLIFEVELFEVK